MNWPLGIWAQLDSSAAHLHGWGLVGIGGFSATTCFSPAPGSLSLKQDIHTSLFTGWPRSKSSKNESFRALLRSWNLHAITFIESYQSKQVTDQSKFKGKEVSPLGGRNCKMLQPFLHLPQSSCIEGLLKKINRETRERKLLINR